MELAPRGRGSGGWSREERADTGVRVAEEVGREAVEVAGVRDLLSSVTKDRIVAGIWMRAIGRVPVSWELSENEWNLWVVDEYGRHFIAGGTLAVCDEIARTLARAKSVKRRVLEALESGAELPAAAMTALGLAVAAERVAGEMWEEWRERCRAAREAYNRAAGTA